MPLVRDDDGGEGTYVVLSGVAELLRGCWSSGNIGGWYVDAEEDDTTLLLERGRRASRNVDLDGDLLPKCCVCCRAPARAMIEAGVMVSDEVEAAEAVLPSCAVV